MNYAAAQARAARQIANAGSSATLEWDGDADMGMPVDVVTDLPSPPTVRRGTVTMAAFPFKLRNLSSDRFQDATEILTRNRRFVMAADSVPVVPTVGMRICGWESAQWTIDGVAPLAPDGSTMLLYTGTMRR